jgi:hypothetical protein
VCKSDDGGLEAILSRFLLVFSFSISIFNCLIIFYCAIAPILFIAIIFLITGLVAFACSAQAFDYIT